MFMRLLKLLKSMTTCLTYISCHLSLSSRLAVPHLVHGS